MRLASVITPFNDKNLALAAQTGVTDITIRYQGPEVADWLPAAVPAFSPRAPPPPPLPAVPEPW